MPVDISAPNWACTVCRTAFGANKAAAERCETAGPPEVLPDGELLLEYEPAGHTRAGFTLHPLHVVPGRIGTRTSTQGKDTGHTVHYLVGVDPAAHTDAEGHLRLPYPEPPRVQSDWITPHRPGHLNVRIAAPIGSAYGTANANSAAWLAAAVGLSRPGAPADADINRHRLRALTAPVAALLVALGAEIVPARNAPHPQYGYRWDSGRGQGQVAAEAARDRAGVVNLARARWWLHGADPAAAVADLNERWRAWRTGADLDVPAPRLHCPPSRRDYRQVTASKLTRDLRALVDAAGVPWPARTNATDYVRLLVDKTLGYEMPSTDLLFRAPAVVAVYSRKGGVGKSTAAAALARAAAERGVRTTVVDCDLSGPSQHLLLNLGAALTDPDTRRLRPSPTALPTLTAFSVGQVFDASTTVHWDRDTSIQWLSLVGSTLDLDEAGLVVLDLPGGEGPVYDVVFDRHRVPLTGAVHVTTGHPLALADSERALRRHAVDLATLPGGHHLVENLSSATGSGPDGQMVTIRLAGRDGAAAELAA